MKKEIKEQINAQAEAMRKNTEADIARLTENAELDEWHETCEKSARQMFAQYQAFIAAGFTETQAWDLLQNIVSGANRPRPLFG